MCVCVYKDILIHDLRCGVAIVYCRALLVWAQDPSGAPAEVRLVPGWRLAETRAVTRLQTSLRQFASVYHLPSILTKILFIHSEFLDFRVTTSNQPKTELSVLPWRESWPDLMGPILHPFLCICFFLVKKAVPPSLGPRSQICPARWDLRFHELPSSTPLFLTSVQVTCSSFRSGLHHWCHFCLFALRNCSEILWHLRHHNAK